MIVNDIYAVLEADATLAAILTGGVYDADVVSEISKATTPDAFVNARLQPCALVQATSASAQSPIVNVSQVFFYVWFYAAGESARMRVQTLLERQRISPTGEAGAWEIRLVGDVFNQFESNLNTRVTRSEYQVMVRR